MGNNFDRIKNRFKQKDILVQLILVNVAVFVVLAVVDIICKLFKLNELNLIEYLAVSSDVTALERFWTPITYMFVHQKVLHILFNMLWLYWFGQIFLSYFNAKQLGSLYILGGLAGAAFYVLTFNTIPYFVDLGPSYAIGASAAVMAIIFAVAFYKPNASVRLFLFGEVKILYIAVILFFIDFLALRSDSNLGGHVAHIGGAILGYAFAKLYLKGTDLTRWITKIMDWLANISLTRKTPKMKVKFKKREDDYQYNDRQNQMQSEIDKILDKIKASGYASLSKEEKQRLFDASRK